MREKAQLGMILLLIVAVVAPEARAGGLISNGGFEAPQVTQSTTYLPGDTALSPWTITSGSVDIVPSAPTSGTGWPAFEATQSLDLNGSVSFPGNGMGVIQQSFATTPGQPYLLFFEYANNPENGSSTVYTARVSVLDSSSATLGSWDIGHSGSSNSSLAAMNYTLFAQTFVADTASTTLEFASTIPGNYGIALDAVSVYSVPEPPSLLLGGTSALVLLGILWFRGR